MRRFWEKAPLIRSIYWRTLGRLRLARERMRRARIPTRQIFEEIFHSNRWRDPESRSGTGSNLHQTEGVRTSLPGLLRRHGVERLLDIPCGDFFWMSRVDLSGIAYTGGDIVPEIVAGNRSTYVHPNVGFLVCDLMQDPLPSADALLVRDCFVHFSFAHIRQALTNIAKQDIRLLITTTFPAIETNSDIVTGEWRGINLKAAPFHFPEPIEILEEGCTECPSARSKSLAVWRIADLRSLRFGSQ